MSRIACQGISKSWRAESPLPVPVPVPDHATGQVVHREYYGHDCVVLVDLNGNGRQIRVRCPGRPPVEIGDRVTIRAHGEVTAWPGPPAADVERA